MNEEKPLPFWSTGKPPGPGAYIGFSNLPERRGEKASLYFYDGEVFQHYTGWYDHGITHWMATDMSAPDAGRAALEQGS